MKSGPSAGDAVSASRLEEILREVGDARYHINHPFHKMMTAGTLDQRARCRPGPSTDIAIRRPSPRRMQSYCRAQRISEFRIEWRERIIDHDGTDDKVGGIRRWIALATGLGLDEAMVMSEAKALPGDPVCGQSVPEPGFAAQFSRSRSLISDRTVFSKGDR